MEKKDWGCKYRRGRQEGRIFAAVFNGRGINPSEQDLHIPLLELHLGSQGIRTVSAEIFVLVPFRQNQEQAFADRDRPSAARTEKLAGFELTEGRRRLPGRILRP